MSFVSTEAAHLDAKPRSRAMQALTLLPRRGVRGTLSRLHRWVLMPIVSRCYLDETHVWFDVPFADDGDVVPEGFELRRGTEKDLLAVAAIGGVSVSKGREYLSRGAQLYVAMNGDKLAFCTWIHVGAVPLSAARDGWLKLPDGVVSFEDSIAAEEYRTTRVSRWSIDAITAAQKTAGVSHIITRVAQENTVARKWARRMGSTEFATMRQRRIGPLRRVWVAPIEGGEPMARELTERLEAEPAPVLAAA